MLDGGFIGSGTSRRLVCALTLRNIGGSKVRLVKNGTGVMVTEAKAVPGNRPSLYSQDFDHLYRYANLYDLLDGKDAAELTEHLTEITPGRPTIVEHRHPVRRRCAATTTRTPSTRCRGCT